jgi:transglutaminase-like putative cysteine protease
MGCPAAIRGAIMSDRFLYVSMILLQAFLLWLTGNTSFVALLVSGLALQSIFATWPIYLESIHLGSSPRRRHAIVVYLIFGPLFVAGLLRESGSAQLNRNAVLLFLGTYLLLLQVLLVLHAFPIARWRRYFPIMTCVTIICAFCQPMADGERTTFLLLAILATAGLAVLFQLDDPPAQRQPGASVLQQAVPLLTLLLTAVGTYATAGVCEKSVTKFQSFLPSWMAQAAGTSDAGSSYVRTGVLGSVTRGARSEPMRVALRVYSRKMPGYLRGRVFDTYSRSQWHLADRRSGKWNRLRGLRVCEPIGRPPNGIPSSRDERHVFAIDPHKATSFNRMEIHNDPERDELFFTPLGTNYIEGLGAYVAVDDHFVIHTGIRAEAPYQVFVASASARSSMPAELRARMLVVPPEMSADVYQLAEQLGHSAKTTRERIERVVTHFQNNYVYAAEGMSIPRNIDPLVHFLTNRPPAHCEFFASGAVVLLRLQGVPCRYVTGYVATELESEYGDYWIARNRNAHAWAEAFDDERGAWTIVEATPGMRAPAELANDARTLAGNSSAGADTTNSQSLSMNWASTRGWKRVAAWIGTYMSPLALGLAIIALPASYMYWGNPLHRARRSTASPRIRQLQQLLRRRDKRLRRRKIQRQANETIHQFADRLLHLGHSAQGDDDLMAAAQWYRQYAAARYGTAELSE